MAFDYERDGGTDGMSLEGEAIWKNVNRPKPTKVQGIPNTVTASVRCGTCGTSDVITGRPGERVTQTTCRTCQQTGTVNKGIGHTFSSRN